MLHGIWSAVCERRAALVQDALVADVKLPTTRNAKAALVPSHTSAQHRSHRLPSGEICTLKSSSCLQLASEQHLTTVISTSDWRATTSTGTSHGVEMKGITWKGSITADAGFGTPGEDVHPQCLVLTCMLSQLNLTSWSSRALSEQLTGWSDLCEQRRPSPPCACVSHLIAAGALLITKTQATPKERLTLYISTVDVTGSGITFDCHSTVASEQAWLTACSLSFDDTVCSWQLSHIRIILCFGGSGSHRCSPDLTMRRASGSSLQARHSCPHRLRGRSKS